MSNYTKLNKEERSILHDFESGALQPIEHMDQAIQRYRAYAAASMQKPQSINIRVAQRDLARIKALAAEQGIPYQTLIGALIHQYSTKPARSPRPSRKSAV